MGVELDVKGSRLLLEEDLAARALAAKREWRCPYLQVSLDEYQCRVASTRYKIDVTDAVLKRAIQLAVAEAPSGEVEVTFDHLRRATEAFKGPGHGTRA
jgi:hypothetical protein